MTRLKRFDYDEDVEYANPFCQECKGLGYYEVHYDNESEPRNVPCYACASDWCELGCDGDRPRDSFERVDLAIAVPQGFGKSPAIRRDVTLCSFDCARSYFLNDDQEEDPKDRGWTPEIDHRISRSLRDLSCIDTTVGHFKGSNPRFVLLIDIARSIIHKLITDIEDISKNVSKYESFFNFLEDRESRLSDGN